MQLAVLGTDADAVALAEAAVAAGHRIVWLGDVRSEDAAAIAQLAPGIAPADDWESLLDHDLTEAVIVGRGMAGEDLRSEQLKRLVTDAVPLLVVHPACPSVLVYYELDMIRREARGVLHHYHPLAGHPLIAELAQSVREGHDAIGPIHQITCERSLAETIRQAAMGWLARDAELLQAVAGGVGRVTAIGPHDQDASYASLQVQMTGRSPSSMRWTVVPGGNTCAVLTLVGERGTLSVQMPDGPTGRWQVEVSSVGQRESQPVEPYDGPQLAMARLAAALAAGEDDAARSTWNRATSAMEVVDAVELSLQKGRSIDIHPQQLTEQLAFRGTMAALGCGMLVLALLAMLVAGVLGDVLKLRLARPWPLVLLLVLAVFLLLQAVPLLVARRRKPRPDAADDDDGS
jgi:predicted dehydrogenase